MKGLEVKSTSRTITIKFPVSILVFATENNPDNEGVKVLSRTGFAREVAAQIKGQFYNNESGLSRFEEFLDEVTGEVIESGSDSISIDGEE